MTAEMRRRGLRLEWATNAWNAMEVVVTIALGVPAGSLALIAFGLDSVVEIFASTVVIRNLHDDRHDPGDRRAAIVAAPAKACSFLVAPREVLRPTSTGSCDRRCRVMGMRHTPAASTRSPS